MEAARIQYAPVKPGEKRRRIARRVLPALVVLLLAPLFWKCGTMAWHRGKVLYWQRASMNRVAPPDQVVMDTSGGSFVSAVEWDRLNTAYAPPGKVRLPTLFLHERKNPGGESRLVAVHCQFPISLQASIFATVVRPGSLYREPQEVSSDNLTLDVWESIRIYAGQPDPADPTHFTINYETNGRKMMVDGWLRNDDKIDFSMHGISLPGARQ